MKEWLLFICLILSSQVSADIFGKDDRFDVKRGTKDFHISKSVAVGVPYSLWDEVSPLLFSLYADDMSSFLCSDEKFSQQKSVSYACTGFLVGEDLLVTAGHCSTNGEEVRNSSENYCVSYTWMFDFRHTTNTDRVPQKNVYNCKEIIYAIEASEAGRHYDFALIRLDRKVTGRKPLKISQSKIRKGDPVKMFGHPMGMPMKVTKNAKVISRVEGISIKTNLDAFAGNSGSPVLNKRNEVIGILVAGNPNDSTYRDKEMGCDRYNHCDENGGNCKTNTLDENGTLSFPHTFSEVQSIERYRKLIEDNQ